MNNNKNNYNNYNNNGNNSSAARDYAVPFAAWELRLYLDTHPDDRDAIAMYNKLCSQYRGGCNYACLPESEYSAERWHWIDDPWPWEAEANNSVTSRASFARRGAERYPQNRFSRRV